MPTLFTRMDTVITMMRYAFACLVLATTTTASSLAQTPLNVAERVAQYVPVELTTELSVLSEK